VPRRVKPIEANSALDEAFSGRPDARTEVTPGCVAATSRRSTRVALAIPRRRAAGTTA